MHIPALVERCLEENAAIEQIAKRYFKANDFLYLGRGPNFPVALEGALKLKEISYIHAEGYPAGEMKHGPIALIDENLPVVVLAGRNGVYEKILANIEEVKARGGIVIGIATEGDARDREKARPRDLGAGDQPAAHADPHVHTAPAPCVSHRGAARRGRGPAEEPGEERDGGVTGCRNCGIGNRKL